MPVNLRAGEDQWMQEPMGASHDGLRNAWKWRHAQAPGVLEHDEVVATLERGSKNSAAGLRCTKNPLTRRSGLC